MITKCQCQSCGGGIEFEVEESGSVVDCPHCGVKTVLELPRVPRKLKSQKFLRPVLWVLGVAFGILMLSFIVLRVADGLGMLEKLGGLMGVVGTAILTGLFIVLAFYWITFPWIMCERLKAIDATLKRIEQQNIK